jgi:predicted permease
VETVGVLAPQLFPFGGPRVRGAIFEIKSKPGGEPRAEVYTASPEYFRSVRIPLLKGRLFTKNDTADAPAVAIISEIVAKRNWPADDPLGQAIRLNAANPNSPWVTVVGVVGDVRNPVGRDVQPTAYRPMAQEPVTGGILLVRTSTDPSSLTGALRARLRDVDPTAPESRIADLEQAVAAYISPQRFSTSLIGLFAGVGLLLAAVGVYGVMRYWVAARVSEIGLRVALGAQRHDVVGLVFRKAAFTVSAGVFVGVIVALALHRVIENQLYGVRPTDPAVFAAVSLLMGVIAVLAALLPAQWAARVDPIVALRHD